MNIGLLGSLVLAAATAGLVAAQLPRDTMNPAAEVVPQAETEIVVSRGRLEPLAGYVHVSASLNTGQPVVARLMVDKGSRVAAGEITAELDQTAANRAAVASNEAQLVRARALLAQLKASAKPAEIARQQALVKQREVELELAEIERQRAEMLRTRGTQSEAALTFRMLDEARLRALLDQARSGLAALGETRQVDLDVASADVAVAEVQLAQSKAQLDVSLVRAPRAGIVTELFARQGERIGSSGIYELADLDRLYAIAEIDEASVSRVRTGARATLFDRVGRELGGGVVARIGSRVFDASRPSENVMLGKNSRIIEVAIKPDDFSMLPPILGLEIIVKIGVVRRAEEPGS
ncbi:MAG TPA: HlyD family efflux transporter periplasmic adaptor subunit [Stellaceae bacterium]|nr:HlyD family efflux transporter periplasmic adaptor subunit [Stellaceae bacterium]